MCPYTITSKTLLSTRTMFLVLFALNIAVAEQCCMPNKWEGVQEIMSASVNMNGYLVTNKLSVEMSVDSTLQRMNSFVTGYIAGTPYKFRALEDYRNNIVYYITYDGFCTNTTQSLPWKFTCLPANSRLTKRGYIGMPNATRTVNMYEVTDPKCYTTFTVDDQCVLIDRTSNNGTISESARLFNVTVGVKTETVFVIPDNCRRNKVTEKVDLLQINFIATVLSSTPSC